MREDTAEKLSLVFFGKSLPCLLAICEVIHCYSETQCVRLPKCWPSFKFLNLETKTKLPKCFHQLAEKVKNTLVTIKDYVKVTSIILSSCQEMYFCMVLNCFMRDKEL